MKEQNVFRSTNPNAPGLVIATGGMPDLGGVQQQIDQLRNQVGAGQDYTQPGNPLTTVYAEYATAAAQVFAHHSVTVCNYGTKIRDTHNAVTVGAAWAFRAPLTGIYHISARNKFELSTAWGLGEPAAMYLYVDGAAVRVLDNTDGPDTAGINRGLELSGNIAYWLNAGQTANVRLVQVSGGNLALLNQAIFNWIHIARVG